MGAIATELGCPAETRRKWVRRTEGGGRTGAAPAPDDRQRSKDHEREHRELRRTHEILRKASAFFAAAEHERAPGSRITMSFIDEHRHVGRVEPICAVLPTPKSTDSAWLRQRRDPFSRAARVQRDEALRAAIRHSWAASRRLCGARKVWSSGGARLPPHSASTARWLATPRHLSGRPARGPAASRCMDANAP
jgi:hypothetical protein